jgi:hypothetical protein
MTEETFKKGEQMILQHEHAIGKEYAVANF